MRCMSPHKATTKPAPALGTNPRTGRMKPLGRLRSDGSWDSDRCVLAMHTRALPRPSCSIRSRSFCACICKSMPAAPYSCVAIASICCTTGVSCGVRNEKVFGRSHAERTASASSVAPAPPRVNPSCTTTVSAPAAVASSLRSVSSLAVSVGKLLIATTHGKPYRRTIWMCAVRLSMPARTAPRSSFARTLNGFPPWDFVARTVVTSTAALGAKLPVRQTMSQNFWNPRSLANPASVTT